MDTMAQVEGGGSMGLPMAGLTAAEWRQLLSGPQAPLLTVTSDSMAPALGVGEQIRVRPAAVLPAAGGLVVYQRGGELVVHRHVGGGRCRGDNRLALDPPFADDAIIGIADAVLRDGALRPIAGRGLSVRLRYAWRYLLESRQRRCGGGA